MIRLASVVLAILLLLAAVAALALAVYQPGPPNDVWNAVRGYLSRRDSSAQDDAAVRQVVHATRPWYFEPQMSKATFGKSVYYGTTYDYEPVRVLDSAPASLGPYAVTYSHNGLRPVPFPPEDLWCVLLSGSDQSSSAVVFVGLHQDLYNADWILHEPRASFDTQDLRATLSRVGCSFAPTQ